MISFRSVSKWHDAKIKYHGFDTLTSLLFEYRGILEKERVEKIYTKNQNVKGTHRKNA